MYAISSKLNLTNNSTILALVLKYFSHFVAYLLLVLMPMQALATANMLVCNSIMQSTNVNLNAKNAQQLPSQSIEQSINQSLAAMPCHQQMTKKSTQQSTSKATCKSICASLCANLCGLTAMQVQIQSIFAVNLAQTFDFSVQTYASITQPNLQRPPILFS